MQINITTISTLCNLHPRLADSSMCDGVSDSRCNCELNEVR